MPVENCARHTTDRVQWNGDGLLWGDRGGKPFATEPDPREELRGLLDAV